MTVMSSQNNPSSTGFNRKWIVIAMLLSALAACATPRSDVGGPEDTLALKECQLAAPGLPARVEAQCGSLTVPEDRANPAGRQITLNIAVLPAVNRNSAPDPLFFLSGGPGQAATETYPQVSFAFEEINRKRDIVLVDQRGTGKSNPLQCPLPQDEAEMTHLGALRERLFQECLTELERKADLRFYTTLIAMADLDAARTALGYDQINLYGVSYGTRAALTYLQQYPQHVRAVILDGVAPQDWDIGLYFARDGQRALDLVFERCAAEAACRAAFPNVRAEFTELLAALDQAPIKLSLPHPVTGKMTDVALTRETAVSSVRLMSYATETVTLLPLLIHTAHANHDYRPLAAQVLQIGGDFSESISDGLQYTVLCSEDVNFTAAEAEQANAGAYVGDLVTDVLLQVCERWPKGQVPASFKTPVTSDVPALLLSGEADPVTPPANGARVAEGLPNSLHLVAPGQGHNVIFRGCLSRVARDFLEKGSVHELDTACVQNIEAPPFFVDFTGPKP
jgi:pimeloyl-ACP methyl ester carboxylesterase